MRKEGESIIINNSIEIEIIDIKGGQVKLGIKSPKGSSVLRKELHDKIHQENIAATKVKHFVEDLNFNIKNIFTSSNKKNNESDSE